LPVTVATTERSFSKFKIIKKLFKELHWTRAIIRYFSNKYRTAEQSHTKKIDIEKNVTNFSIMKARRMKFD